MILSACWLLACYLVASWVRWRYARHYCQPFRLMSPADVREAWRLTVESRWSTYIRVAAVTTPVAGAVACYLLEGLL